MGRNLKRYAQAFRLRENGKTLREIGEIMGVSPERVRIMVNYLIFQKNKKSTSRHHISS